MVQCAAFVFCGLDFVARKPETHSCDCVKKQPYSQTEAVMRICRKAGRKHLNRIKRYKRNRNAAKRQNAELNI